SLRESTSCIASSIYENRTINGRAYQAPRPEYWAPTDNQHTEGNDIAHQYTLMLMENKLYAAPIKNPKKILDVGTGTGIWAMQFPEAEVIGTDISAVQPSSAQLSPASCRQTARSKSMTPSSNRCSRSRSTSFTRAISLRHRRLAQAVLASLCPPQARRPGKDQHLKRVGQFNGLYIDLSLDGFAVFPVGQVLGWTLEEVPALVSSMRKKLEDPKSLPYYNL
ncbi:hypothetical protein B0H67DRAFT_497881, partial [Lasiosphaeris hirsuta]